MIRRIAAIACALALLAAMGAGGPTSKPCGSAPAASMPATATAPVSPAVMKILNRLEEAGLKYPNIVADIDYVMDRLQTGEREQRTGTVSYRAAAKGSPAKFRIGFKTLRYGKGRPTRRVVDYAFDGEWFTTRKEKIKEMVRYQTPPGQRASTLRLGKGPFPVPFGQRAADVIRYFQPSTRPATAKDPKNADYLKLLTRRLHRRELTLVWVEMWVDRSTGLPVRIVTEDRSENRTDVTFKNVKTPKSIADKVFHLPRPGAGWEYRVERFKGEIR